MSLLCYTYDADHHCVRCTMEYARKVEFKDYLFHLHPEIDESEFSKNGLINLKDAIDLELIPDSENNPIHAMLDNEEWYANDIYEGNSKATLVCGTCGEVIEEMDLTE